MRRFLIWLALAAGVGRFAFAQEEWTRAYEGYVPGAEPAGVVAVLVRHSRTRQPLGGVEILAYREDVQPVAVRAPVVARTVTDEFGLAWLETPEEDVGHWVFHRPDLAPLCVGSRGAAGTVDLAPGRPAAGRLVGALGEPLQGVRVAVVGRCHHGPILREARTDGEGVFRLGPLDPEPPYPARLTSWDVRLTDDIWLDQDVLFALGETMPILAARPGIVVQGRVTGPDGTPVPGCVVRGPLPDDVAVTDERGTFRLSRLQLFDELRVFHPEWCKGLVSFFEMRGVSGSELQIRFPPGPGGVRVLFPLRLVDATSRAPLAGFPVRIVDGASGLVLTALTSGDPAYASPGTVPLELPRGSYRVYIGSPFSPFQQVETARGPQSFGQIDVSAGLLDPRIVACHAANAKASIELVAVPKEARITVAAAGFARSVSPGALQGGFPVPATGPVAVHVEAEGVIVVERLGAIRDGVRAGRIEWPRPKQIQMTLPRGMNSVVIGSPDGITFEEPLLRKGEAILRTHASGHVRLEVIGDLKGRGESSVEVEVDIPRSPGARIPVRVPAPRPRIIEVRLANGRPATGARVDLETEQTGDLAEALDEEGRARSRWFREGSVVTIRKMGHVDLHRRLEGEGPYLLAYGPCMLVVDLATDAGEQLAGVLYVDGRMYDAAQTTRLRGLQPGPHLIIAAAEGHVGQAWRLVLREGETRRVAARLRPRPRVR